MVNAIKYKIKDTGLDKPDGSVIYTPVNSGNWIDLLMRTNNFEFGVNSTNNSAPRTDPDNSSLMDFKNNELTSIQTPRMTLRGLIKASDSTVVTNLINLRNSKSVKQLTGGLGTIDGMPGHFTDTTECIYVLIKNLTISEVIGKDDNYADVTIQLEQLR